MISRAQIQANEHLIRPHIRRTPVLEVDGADFGLDSTTIVFKLELFQHGGSFKARGAFMNLLTRDVPDVGVVAASGGNHGVAVAFAAMKLGRRARIFVPSVASPAKIDRIRRYGAELVIGGDRYADALEASQEWTERTGALPIHAYEAVETLLGQGTVGLELEGQSPKLDSLLVAVGGGGLIGGVAAWYEEQDADILGRTGAGADTQLAFEAGHPVDAPPAESRRLPGAAASRADYVSDRAKVRPGFAARD